MAGYRSERVSERIHQEVSLLFSREIADPRLAGANVTRVEVSGDLRLAKIYIAPGDDEAEDKERMAGLAHATGYIRRRIGSSVDLRFAPELRFYIDRSIEKGEHFLQVLAQVQEEEREAKSAPTKPASPAPRKRQTRK